jgi:hypothetical protein
MAQPSAELARGFAFVSLAVAEGFDATLELGGSRRRLFELADKRQQSPKLVFVKFFHQQDLLPALKLQRDLVGFTIRFSAGIHPAFPFLASNMNSFRIL